MTLSTISARAALAPGLDTASFTSKKARALPSTCGKKARKGGDFSILEAGVALPIAPKTLVEIVDSGRIVRRFYTKSAAQLKGPAMVRTTAHPTLPSAQDEIRRETREDAQGLAPVFGGGFAFWTLLSLLEGSWGFFLTGVVVFLLLGGILFCTMWRTNVRLFGFSEKDVGIKTAFPSFPVAGCACAPQEEGVRMDKDQDPAVGS